MRNCIILFILALQAMSVQGQPATKAVVDQTEAEAAIEKPQYPGGAKELQQFLLLNLRYPSEAMDKKVEGEVWVSFNIGADGTISDIRTVKRIGFGCDEEAERVVKKMPAWLPATRNGKPVAVHYKLPVVFELPAKSF